MKSKDSLTGLSAPLLHKVRTLGVRLLVDALDLPYWLTKQPVTFDGSSQRQFTGESHLLVKRHIWIFPTRHPSNLQPSPVGREDVAPRLGGVTIRAVLGLQHIAFCPKVLSVKCPNQMSSVSRPKTPIWSG